MRLVLIMWDFLSLSSKNTKVEGSLRSRKPRNEGKEEQWKWSVQLRWVMFSYSGSVNTETCCKCATLSVLNLDLLDKY